MSEAEYFEQFTGHSPQDMIQHSAYVGDYCPHCGSTNTYRAHWYDGGSTGVIDYQCITCWRMYSEAMAIIYDA